MKPTAAQKASAHAANRIKAIKAAFPNAPASFILGLHSSTTYKIDPLSRNGAWETCKAT